MTERSKREEYGRFTATRHGSTSYRLRQIYEICSIRFQPYLVLATQPTMNGGDTPESRSADPVKDATLIALRRILDPLLNLVFDAGITMQEFNRIARDRAVRVAAARVARENGRPSKSRVAIMTGMPRSEVAKILNVVESVSQSRPEQHPARRVLAAWHDDPRFLSSNGQPSVLPIFGRRRSFERLVEKYGGGHPVRAMLDELVQLGAVDQLPNQRIHAKARVPIVTGLHKGSIESVGERAGDLLGTLVHNVRNSKRPLFEATAWVDDGDTALVNRVRREITEQGTNFINSANSLLNRSKIEWSPRRSYRFSPIPHGCQRVLFPRDENRQGRSEIS